MFERVPEHGIVVCGVCNETHLWARGGGNEDYVTLRRGPQSVSGYLGGAVREVLSFIFRRRRPGADYQAQTLGDLLDRLCERSHELDERGWTPEMSALLRARGIFKARNEKESSSGRDRQSRARGA
jgi:hypothetical protein